MQNARGKHVCAGLGDNMAMVVGGEGAHYSTEIYRVNKFKAIVI